MRFDDVIADALKLGPLRQRGPELPPVLLEKLRVAVSSGIPFEIVQTLVAYYIVNKLEDSDWAVLPAANFDACFKALENLMIFNENGEGSTPLVRKAWRIIGVF